MTIVPLGEATDEDRYGGKATELAAAMDAGLPVPAGIAIPWAVLEALSETGQHRSRLIDRLRAMEGPYVVRSSGVEEDGAAASFAGQHDSVINVLDAAGVIDALQQVHASARSEVVSEYRERMGIEGPPRMGAVIQTLVDADTAGVLFTRNPVDGNNERVVEAAWGLCQSVVEGMVTPDNVRIQPGGEVVERRPGQKDVQVEPSPDGGTRTVDVPEPKRNRFCLREEELGSIDRLADRCEAYRRGGHDVEWAFEEGDLYLLQRRDITTGV